MFHSFSCARLHVYIFMCAFSSTVAHFKPSAKILALHSSSFGSGRIGAIIPAGSSLVFQLYEIKNQITCVWLAGFLRPGIQRLGPDRELLNSTPAAVLVPTNLQFGDRDIRLDSVQPDSATGFWNGDFPIPDIQYLARELQPQTFA